MTRSNQLISLILASCVILPAQAAGIHKWVDTKGVTHYSDKAPDSSSIPVTLIEVPANYSVATTVEDDYYSIANQWMRLHKERLAQEKISLEKARQKSVQSPPEPQIVVIKESNETRYANVFPRFVYRKHGHRRFHHKYKRNPGYARAKVYRGGRSNRNYRGGFGLGSFKHVAG